MKVKFNNNSIFNVATINGTAIYYQGANRDSLEFQFDKSAYTFEQLESLTGNPDNVKKITIIDDDNQIVGVHENYVLRVQIGIQQIELDQPITPDEPPTTEERLCVKLAQMTYVEQQMKKLQEQVDALTTNA